jgi:DtxR family transcriptional regulator, Mn-dependent transcriptional regulator
MLSRNIEDYLEAIYNICKEKETAKTADIARALDIRPPSVTEMLIKLRSKGLVSYYKYKGVTLTEKGAAIAEMTARRHDTLVKLLKMLKVPSENATKDACTMEHHLSIPTIRQLKKFVDFCSWEENSQWLKSFEKFSEELD